MRNNYKKGADFERYVCRIYRHLGYFVVRSAGSHTPVDVVAIPTGAAAWAASHAYTILIQCKANNRMSKADYDYIRALADDCDCLPMLAYKMKGPFKGWTRCEEVIEGGAG